MFDFIRGRFQTGHTLTQPQVIQPYFIFMHSAKYLLKGSGQSDAAKQHLIPLPEADQPDRYVESTGD